MINEKIPIEVRHTLRDLRTRIGLNRTEAAKELGISVPTLMKWENDSSNLRYSDISKVTRFYNIPEDYIFFGTDNAFNEKINGVD